MVVDLNGDGLLDVLQVNRWDKAQVWRQLPTDATKGNHWLQLKLNQPAGNRDAVGAWVEVKLKDDKGERVIRQELTVGGGHASGQIGWMHFGLGVAADVQVRVQWPQAGWSEWMSAKTDSFYSVNPKGIAKWSAP
jgi:hypothetical protein